MRLLRQILALLQPRQRRKGAWITLLVFANSLLDFCSLAGFVSIVTAVLSPGAFQSNVQLQQFYLWSGADDQRSFLITLTVFLLGFLVIRNVFSIWVARIKVQFAFDVGNFLSSANLSRFMARTHADFTESDFASELHRLTTYPISFANNILLPLLRCVAEIFVSLLVIGGLVWIEYRIIALFGAMGLPLFALYRYRKKMLDNIGLELKVKYPLLLKSGMQIVEGFPEITVYNKQRYFQERFERANRHFSNVLVKDQFTQAVTTPVIELFVGMLICSLIVYSVIGGDSPGQTVFMIGLVAAAALRMMPSVIRIANAVHQLSTNSYVIEHLKTVNAPSVGCVPLKVETPEFHKTVSVTGLTIRYRDGTQPLKDVQLTLRKGEKVAITGNSGEGKTTLLLGILQLIDSPTGEIRVDGRRITQRAGWWKLIAYVPQSPYLFDGTILENIAFGSATGQVDQSRAQQILVGLGLGSLLDKLPLGVHTTIGERGVRLSGGQRQRLAIARGLYANAQILLLDEITNHIHSDAITSVFEMLEELARAGKTIIVVSHLVHDRDFFDTLYRLEDGKLIKLAVKEPV